MLLHPPHLALTSGTACQALGKLLPPRALPAASSRAPWAAPIQLGPAAAGSCPVSRISQAPVPCDSSQHLPQLRPGGAWGCPSCALCSALLSVCWQGWGMLGPWWWLGGRGLVPPGTLGGSGLLLVAADWQAPVLGSMGLRWWGAGLGLGPLPRAEAAGGRLGAEPCGCCRLLPAPSGDSSRDPRALWAGARELVLFSPWLPQCPPLARLMPWGGGWCLC